MPHMNPLKEKRQQQQKAKERYEKERVARKKIARQKKDVYTKALGIRKEINTVLRAPDPHVEAERIKSHIETLNNDKHASSELIEALRSELVDKLTQLN